MDATEKRERLKAQRDALDKELAELGADEPSYKRGSRWGSWRGRPITTKMTREDGQKLLDDIWADR